MSNYDLFSEPSMQLLIINWMVSFLNIYPVCFEYWTALLCEEGNCKQENQLDGAPIVPRKWSDWSSYWVSTFMGFQFGAVFHTLETSSLGLFRWLINFMNSFNLACLDKFSSNKNDIAVVRVNINTTFHDVN